MSAASKIEWTDYTWNPVGGCREVSPGCANCYARMIAARFSGPGMPYEGLAEMTPQGPRWTGEFRMIEKHLGDPLRWRKPRRVFVNSTSDLFGEALSNHDVARVFAVMAACPQHTFQVLTKRAERMAQAMSSPAMRSYALSRAEDLFCQGGRIRGAIPDFLVQWPPRNIWLGVSVEDQKRADERIPHLLRTPAAVRFLSVEPLLERVDSARWFVKDHCPEHDFPGGFCHGPCASDQRVDWVICGGESGLGARPMHPDWARSLRDQCVAAGVPFFFKQWGQFGPSNNGGYPGGRWGELSGDLVRVGKKAAGRLLDGRTWDQFPEVARG